MIKYSLQQKRAQGPSSNWMLNSTKNMNLEEKHAMQDKTHPNKSRYYNAMPLKKQAQMVTKSPYRYQFNSQLML